MFLTPRSVCVLVCSAEAFAQQQHSGGGAQQLADDVPVLEQLGVLGWLRCISRRVPESDVVLVATKCDVAGRNVDHVGRRIELACRMWQTSWERDGMRPVRVEKGVSLTSCSSTLVHGQGEGGSWKNRCFRSGCCYAAMSGQGKSSTGPYEGWPCDWRENTDTEPSPSLLHRLVHTGDGGGLRGVRMVLPRSWDIALTALEAFELGRWA